VRVVLVTGIWPPDPGEGPDRLALERRAGELGLDGRARFLGNVSREGVLWRFGDDDLRRRLAEAAQGSVATYTEEAVFGRIEEKLARVSQL